MRRSRSATSCSDRPVNAAARRLAVEQRPPGCRRTPSWSPPRCRGTSRRPNRCVAQLDGEEPQESQRQTSAQWTSSRTRTAGRRQRPVRSPRARRRKGGIERHRRQGRRESPARAPGAARRERNASAGSGGHRRRVPGVPAPTARAAERPRRRGNGPSTSGCPPRTQRLPARRRGGSCRCRARPRPARRGCVLPRPLPSPPASGPRLPARPMKTDGPRRGVRSWRRVWWVTGAPGERWAEVSSAGSCSRICGSAGAGRGRARGRAPRRRAGERLRRSGARRPGGRSVAGQHHQRTRARAAEGGDEWPERGHGGRSVTDEEPRLDPVLLGATRSS